MKLTGNARKETNCARNRTTNLGQASHCYVVKPNTYVQRIFKRLGFPQGMTTSACFLDNKDHALGRSKTNQMQHNKAMQTLCGK